jgi:tetratricopeptide (TPR) repeat protein
MKVRVSAARFVAVLCIGFSACGGNEAGSRDDRFTEDSLAERSAIVDFWKTYRAATRARIDGEMGRARELYQQALAYDALHEDSWYYLGHVRLELGDAAGARAALERLVEINPHSVRGLVTLGDVYQCAEWDTAAAARAYRRAMQTNREETGPQMRLARLAILQEDWDTAEQLLAAVTSSNLKSIDGFYLRGYLAWRIGDRTRSAAYLGEAVGLTRTGRPTEPLGEGDTRTGSGPLAQRSATCELWEDLEAMVAALSESPDEGSIDVFYGEVENRVEAMRQSGRP